MAKIGIVPDTHGNNKWIDLLSEYGGMDKLDKLVFLGDYCDSRWVTIEDIVDNLNQIVAIKKEYPDKVVLLVGNHDLQYMYTHYYYGCSGFNPLAWELLNRIFSENRELFKPAYQIDNIVFTHAGIQHNWFVNSFKGDLTKNIADQLNDVLSPDQNRAVLQIGFRRGGGSDVGGIYWADREELKKPLKDHIQIAGHNVVGNRVTTKHRGGTIHHVDFLENMDTLLVFDTESKTFNY